MGGFMQQRTRNISHQTARPIFAACVQSPIIAACVRKPIIVAYLLCLSLAIGGCARDLTWSAVDRLIAASYPEVPTISTDSLASLLSSDRGGMTASRPYAARSDSVAFLLDADPSDAPILLDVRTADEFAVSHLAGAIRVEPGTDPAQLDSLRGRGPIVTYCSVGYRSAELASMLIDAGFSDVSNLRGSIFRWANEGRPVYRDGRRVREVHPYDEIWGVLLDPSLRTKLPDHGRP